MGLILALPGPTRVQAQDPGADLRKGIRQVEDGDLEAAAVTLEAVIQHLAGSPGQERELATAHLYLAMAQLGLGQLDSARAHMREAWFKRKGAQLDPKKFPPRIVRLDEEAGRGSRTAPQAKQKGEGTEAEAVTDKSKALPLLIGIGAASSATGFAVGKGTRPNAPSPLPPSSSKPPLRTIRLFNCDDEGRASLNGQPLVQVGLGQDSGLSTSRTGW